MGHRTENDKINLDLWRNEKSNQALDKMVCQYEKSVFSFILYFSGCDWDAAYEIAADSFVEIFAEIKSSVEESLPVQLFTRVMDKCSNVKAIPLFDPVKFINAADPRKNLLRTAKEALIALSSDQKAMLLLRDQANLSYEEIASIVQVPFQDIKNRTWQARNNFRDKVEKILDRNRG